MQESIGEAAVTCLGKARAHAIMQSGMQADNITHAVYFVDGSRIATMSVSVCF